MHNTKTKKPAKPAPKAKAPAKPAPKAKAAVKAKAPAKPVAKAKTPAKPAPKAKAPAKPVAKAKAPAKAVTKPAPKAKVIAKAPAKPAPKAKAPVKAPAKVEKPAKAAKAEVKVEPAKKGKAAVKVEDTKELKGKKAKAVGVDGLILPDLPLYEFENEYGKTIQENELDFIFLVTPETPEARLRKLDSLSSGFLYAVSSSATTGTDKDFTKVALYLERLKTMELKNPLLVGFGIKDKASFDAVNAYANGAIIGSAFIQALSKGQPIDTTTEQFLKGVLGN